MSEQMKQNLSNSSHWLRLLLTVLYALIFWLGIWVLGFVVVLNLIILLISGERNQQLSGFGGQVAAYLGQIMTYTTQNSDEKPFPFGDWPQGSANGSETGAETRSEPEPEPVPASEPDPKPAPKPRKKSARKKSSKKKVNRKPADQD